MPVNLNASYLVGLSCFSVVAVEASDIPEIQMHIFDEPLQASKAESTIPAMQMVIFSSDQVESKPAVKGYDYRLNIKDNNEVVAQAETVPVSVNNRTWVDDMAVEYYFDSGYRIDNFDWTIADPSGEPNILSELSWKNLEIVSFELGGQLKLNSNWLFAASIHYGTILDGENQDSDYLGNDRTQEFSRSVNQSD